MTDLELGRRDRKKQQTRAALSAAALRLVNERGLERVTVEEISEAADVSSRTFFNYFATKDEALIDDPLVDAGDIRARLAGIDPGLPLIGAMLLAMHPAIEQIQADRELWLLRMRVIERNPALLPALLARSTHAEREFTGAVAARTALPAGHVFPQVAASAMGAAFRVAMMRWAAGGGTADLDDLVHESFGVLAGGLSEPTSTDRERE